MIRKDATYDQIDSIMAHPQVFAQCERNIARKYPHLQLLSGEREMINTARAALALANGELSASTAILGPEILSQMYNFLVVESDIQDSENNITKFLLVKR